MGGVNKSPNSFFATFGFAIFPFTSFDLGDFFLFLLLIFFHFRTFVMGDFFRLQTVGSSCLPFFLPCFHFQALGGNKGDTTR